MSATIACLPGDGIGPEVMDAALRVLEATAERFGLELALEEGLIGGAAIDAGGVPLPESTAALCDRADAVLLGAVGGPRWSDPEASVRPEQGLLDLRRRMAVYGNLRPVRAIPGIRDASPVRPEVVDGADMLIVRELTGGIYFGERRLENGLAVDTCSYTTEEVERTVRLAARLAQGRRRRLTLVDKANVLETSRLWRRVATRIAREEYPDLEFDCMLVDAAAMQVVARPDRFDVIVTDNLFGDILSDGAAVLAGSLGVLPSASIGEGGAGLYEPVHGSAPDIAGRDAANPVGMILSVAMMLRHSLARADAAGAIEGAVDAAMAARPLTPDLAGGGPSVTTGELTGRIIDALAHSARPAPTA